MIPSRAVSDAEIEQLIDTTQPTAIPGPATAGQRLTPRTVARLQRSIGNAATARTVQRLTTLGPAMTPEDMFNKLTSHIMFEHGKYGHVPVHQLHDVAKRLEAMEQQLSVNPTPELRREYTLLKQRYDMSREGPGAANPRPGYNTTAIIEAVDKDGQLVAVAFGDYDSAGHAEEHAIDDIRRQLGGRKLPGGRIEVVGDKVVCESICAPRLKALATELQAQRVDSHVFRREALRQADGKPVREAGEKTTMNTQTKATSEGKPLTRRSATLYERAESEATPTAGPPTAEATVPVATESNPSPGKPAAQHVSLGTPDMEDIHIGGPDARGTAIGDGIILGLQGLNFVLGRLNEARQRRRLEEALAAREPEIARLRRERPDCGVVLAIHFRVTDGNPDSPIEPGPVFERIELGVGRSPREARKDLERTPELLPGLLESEHDVIVDTLWVPALKPQAPMPPPPPFPVFSLATFASRNPSLQNVKWTNRGGFDDEDPRQLSVPEGLEPRFYVLQLPAEFASLIPRAHDPEIMRQQLPLGTRNGMPVVRLDPWLPFFDVAAAALFPADQATADLFETAPPTSDQGTILTEDFDLIRWARPDQIKLLGR